MITQNMVAKPIRQNPNKKYRKAARTLQPMLNG